VLPSHHYSVQVHSIFLGGNGTNYV
jgi:hypothetical protein